MPERSEQTGTPDGRDLLEKQQAGGAERRYTEALFHSLRASVLLLDTDFRVLSANPSFYETYGVRPEETEGRPVYRLGNGQWDIPQLRALLGDVLPKSEAFRSVEVAHTFEHIGRRVLLFNACRLREVQRIVLVVEDITGRRRAAQEHHASEEQFRLLIENAKEYAIFVMDPKSRITMWNTGAEHVLGWSKEEALGRPGEIIFPPEQCTGGVPEKELETARTQGAAEGERWHVRKDGSRFWGSGMMVALHGDNGALRGFAKILRDNTRRKRSEEALRQQKRRWEILSEAAAGLLSAEDPDEMVYDLFHRVSHEFGLDACFNYMVEGQDLRLVAYVGIPEENARQIEHLDFGEAVCGTVAATGRRIYAAAVQQSDDPMFALLNEFGIRAYACHPLVAGGRVLGTLSFGSRDRDRFSEEELAFFGTVSNYVAVAKERLRTEKQLRELNETLEQRVAERTRQVRELASRLTMAEQAERRRIAQILHDNLQQLLYGTQMRLAFLREDAEGGNLAQLARSAGEISELLGEAVGTTRRLTVELSPPVLRQEGLATALRWLAKQMKDLYSLEVEVEADQEFAISDEDMRVLLFQIARELLFNVTKHAEVDRARIVLEKKDRDLLMQVIDEGRGFDIEAAEQEHHGSFGLFSVRERLGLFGGRTEIDTAPGGGTHVTIYAPLEPERP